jgi:hypothetical protein
VLGPFAGCAIPLIAQLAQPTESLLSLGESLNKLVSAGGLWPALERRGQAGITLKTALLAVV